MSKDTNSFGHDKALACESRGFVYKKRGCIVLTHPPCRLMEVVSKKPLPLGGGLEEANKSPQSLDHSQ